MLDSVDSSGLPPKCRWSLMLRSVPVSFGVRSVDASNPLACSLGIGVEAVAGFFFSVERVPDRPAASLCRLWDRVIRMGENEERSFSVCSVSAAEVLSAIFIVISGSSGLVAPMSSLLPEPGIFGDASIVFGGVSLVLGLRLALPPGFELEPDRRRRLGVRAFEAAVRDRCWDGGFCASKLPTAFLGLSVLGKSSESSSLETVACEWDSEVPLLGLNLGFLSFLARS